MEEVSLIRFALSFMVVLGLIGLMALALRYYGNRQWGHGKNRDSTRLSVVETRPIDYKRKLVLIRRDDVEHLILCADGREVVVESNIQKKEAT